MLHIQFFFYFSVQLSIMHICHKFRYYINMEVNSTHIEWYQTYKRLYSTAKETSFSTGEKKSCSKIIPSVIKMYHLKISCETLL